LQENMKANQILTIIGIVLLLAGGIYFATKHSPSPTVQNNQTNTSTNSVVSPSTQFGFPIDQALTRITKKPFGIYITPKTSPVQPEKFTGYHTGTDFETFPSEADTVVTIKAVTAGKVVYKQWVSGYGGVLVQSAEVNGQPVTMLYGHLALSSISLKVGDNLALGDTIGELGKGYSHDTDGERKHLHLGVHKGSQVVLLGYVPSPSELSSWIDITTLWK
jgi:murein DD-endopeptidase MepM/ murein hydrolase activator NlpD